MRIFKYKLIVTDEQVLLVPVGARLLTVQVQGADPHVWAEVDPAQPLTWHIIRIFGTGNPMPEDTGTYLGTFQQGQFVWHVYDGGEVQDATADARPGQTAAATA